MKLTQATAVLWAIAILKGEPLPEYAPTKEEVIEALTKLQISLERK